MSAAKHTPGPWIICRDHPDPKTAAGMISIKSESQSRGESSLEIAMLFCASHGSEGEANARLIAAVPDMLAALKAADAHFTGTFSENGTDHQLVRAAIAKAEEGK